MEEKSKDNHPWRDEDDDLYLGDELGCIQASPTAVLLLAYLLGAFVSVIGEILNYVS